MSRPAPTVIVGHDLIRPDDQPTFITTPSMWRSQRGHIGAGPDYRTSEVAMFFFGRGTAWIRHLLADGVECELTGPVEPERTAHGTRKWRLHDVELLAYALAENRIIDGRQLMIAINLISLQAKMWGFLA